MVYPIPNCMSARARTDSRRAYHRTAHRPPQFDIRPAVQRSTALQRPAARALRPAARPLRLPVARAIRCVAGRMPALSGCGIGVHAVLHVVRLQMCGRRVRELLRIRELQSMLARVRFGCNVCFFFSYDKTTNSLSLYDKLGDRRPTWRAPRSRQPSSMWRPRKSPCWPPSSWARWLW